MEATGGPLGEAGQGLAARASPTAQAGSRAGPGAASTLGTGNLPGAQWGCGPAAGAVGLPLGLARRGAQGRAALLGQGLIALGHEMGSWAMGEPQEGC